MLIDSHCHLDYPDYAAELDGAVARARAAGVGGMVTISTRLDLAARVRAVAEKYEDIWCSVGSHPHEAEKEPIDDAAPIVALCDHPKVIGIGETGLDYYYDYAPRARQMANFRAHIAAAQATGLPLIVHAREADEDIADMLEREMAEARFSCVLHCFSSGRDLAMRALALGCYLSISGMVTFAKAESLRAILADVPLDRLLVETDSPYLAPIPHRGQRNEPAFVTHTAAALAAVKKVAADDMARISSENFFRLFAKAVPPR